MKRTIRYHLTRLWFPTFAILVLLYFIYHLVEGDHGLRALHILEKQLALSESILKEKSEHKNTLEHRVNLLRPENLDTDLLEERVRAMLNHAAPEEVVVLYEEDDAPGAEPVQGKAEPSGREK